MDRQRRAEWAARVVAWHNRHPLARRITPEQVQSTGWVDLPFRAGEQPARRGWQAAFSEDFLPPLSPRRIARWALRHAQEQAPDLADAPVRRVLIDRSRTEGQAVALWLASAAIVAGGAQTRVLIAPAGRPAVLGRRLLSRPRLATAALVLLLTGLAPLVPAWLPQAGAGLELATADTASAAAPAASGAVQTAAAGASAATAHGVASHPITAGEDGADVGAVTDAVTDADTPADTRADADGSPKVHLVPSTPLHPAASPADAVAERTTPAAALPAHGEPLVVAVASQPLPALPVPPPAAEIRAGRVSLPLPPLLDDAAKAAARDAAARARAAREAERAVGEAARAAVVYAVATARVRTQAESEILGETLQAALAGATAPRCARVEALPAGEDWRTVCWPFVRREDAERLRSELIARGQRLEVIEF